MIDIHCHILPGADDGPRSRADSLSMARMALEDGIHTIVATPHTLNGVYRNPIGQIRSMVRALQDSLVLEGIGLHVAPGADVHLCPEMMERIKSGDAGTINDAGKYVLLEFPPQNIPAGVKDEIFALKLNGITPIITHPERNLLIQHNLQILYDLVSMGALCQVTAMSITGDFGELSRRCVESMLERRLAHVIASDAHSADSRPPLLSRAVESAAEILGDYEAAERMVAGVPAAILAGEVVDIPEPSWP